MAVMEKTVQDVRDTVDCFFAGVDSVSKLLLPCYYAWQLLGYSFVSKTWAQSFCCFT
jgi:hypothetical protein